MFSIAQQNYLKQKIDNATPIGRVIILCEGCVKFLSQAKESLLRGDKIEFTDKVIKAQNIIRELRNSLNLDLDPKAAGGFYLLYNYMLKALMRSVRTKTLPEVESVIKMISKLNEAWKEADSKGLANDLKRYEDRGSNEVGSIKRRVGVDDVCAYQKLSEGLNLVS